MKLVAWDGRKMRTYSGNVIPFNDDCELFRSAGGKKWWLYYGENHVTGSFKTKKAATGWYSRGGR